jgi:hypothetical protein
MHYDIPTISKVLDSCYSNSTESQELKDAGAIFRFLDLATPDPSSPGGWRPTERLMRMHFLIDSTTRKTRTYHPWGSLILILCNLALGEDGYGKATLAINVMTKIGLLRQAKKHELWPTVSGEFVLLFADAYEANITRGAE